MSAGDPQIDGLPPLLAEIAEVAGTGAALSLVAAHGGQRIYIPASMGDGHPLVRLLGRDAADALAGRFGPAALDVPRFSASTTRRRAADAVRLRAEGKSANAVARQLGTTRRHVFRLAPAEPAEAPLLDRLTDKPRRR